MKTVEVKELVSAVPISMTRREKLLRWAQLVRGCKHYVALYSNLEYMTDRQLATVYVSSSDHSAFAVAAKDLEFRAQGLGDRPNISSVLQFFDISQEEAHAFSCDCGGSITNEQQAHRIEKLASAR